MRKRISIVITGLLVAVMALVGGSLALAGSSSAATAAVPVHTGNITCAKDGTRAFVVWDRTCPTGYHYAQIPAQDVYGIADVAPLPAGVAAPAVSPIRIVHKSVTVNADFQAGTVAERTVTFAGLPAYASSGSAEIRGDNTAGLPDALTASIAVAPVAPGNGQTTRAFVVNAAGFTGTETYVLDLWVLVTS